MKHITTQVTADPEKSIRSFCLQIVKEFYDVDYQDDWAYDLDSFDSYYTHPLAQFLVIKKNNTYIATAAIRPLTSAPEILEKFKNRYGSGDNIGLITRVFVAKEYRGKGLGKKIYAEIENFARQKGFVLLYLHATYSPDVASFWQKMGFTVIEEEQDSFRTVHMEKYL